MPSSAAKKASLVQPKRQLKLSPPSPTAWPKTSAQVARIKTKTQKPANSTVRKCRGNKRSLWRLVGSWAEARYERLYHLLVGLSETIWSQPRRSGNQIK